MIMDAVVEISTDEMATETKTADQNVQASPETNSASTQTNDCTQRQRSEVKSEGAPTERALDTQGAVPSGTDVKRIKVFV